MQDIRKTSQNSFKSIFQITWNKVTGTNSIWLCGFLFLNWKYQGYMWNLICFFLCIGNNKKNTAFLSQWKGRMTKKATQEGASEASEMGRVNNQSVTISSYRRHSLLSKGLRMSADPPSNVNLCVKKIQPCYYLVSLLHPLSYLIHTTSAIETWLEQPCNLFWISAKLNFSVMLLICAS